MTNLFEAPGAAVAVGCEEEDSPLEAGRLEPELVCERLVGPELVAEAEAAAADLLLEMMTEASLNWVWTEGRRDGAMELRMEARLAIRDAADLEMSAATAEVTEAMEAEITEATEAELTEASDSAVSAGVEGVATAALTMARVVCPRTRLRVVVLDDLVTVGDATTATKGFILGILATARSSSRKRGTISSSWSSARPLPLSRLVRTRLTSVASSSRLDAPPRNDGIAAPCLTGDRGGRRSAPCGRFGMPAEIC